MILEKFKSPSIVVLILVLCQTWSLLAAAPALPLPANYHFYNSLPPPPAKRFADKGKYKSKIFVGKERAQHEVEPCDGGSWGFCCDVFASLVYFAKCPANIVEELVLHARFSFQRRPQMEHLSCLCVTY